MSYHGKQTPISRTVDPPGDTQAGAARLRLLDEIRSRLRLKHDTLRTEKASLYWIRRSIHANGCRYPRELDGVSVERFRSCLATEHAVAPGDSGAIACGGCALRVAMGAHRRRTGIPLAGNRATSSPPSRIGTPCSGAQAMAVMTSQVAGRRSASRNAS